MTFQPEDVLEKEETRCSVVAECKALAIDDGRNNGSNNVS
jgi:hypothetical protein